MLGVSHPYKQLLRMSEKCFLTKKLLLGATQSIPTSALGSMLLLNIIA